MNFFWFKNLYLKISIYWLILPIKRGRQINPSGQSIESMQTFSSLKFICCSPLQASMIQYYKSIITILTSYNWQYHTLNLMSSCSIRPEKVWHAFMVSWNALNLNSVFSNIEPEKAYQTFAGLIIKYRTVSLVYNTHK